jgi:preprotein translocase subunit SecD
VSSRRNHLVLVLLILVALAGVGLLAVPGSPFHRSVKKGLDLQGGLEVVLKAQPPKGHKLTADDLSRSVTIMRNRVDKLGVASPEIRTQTPDEIVIELAGVHNPQQAAAVIGQTAQLELYDLEPALVSPSVTVTGNPVATTSLCQLLTRVQGAAKAGSPGSTASIRTPARKWFTPPMKRRATSFPRASRSAPAARPIAASSTSRSI